MAIGEDYDQSAERAAQSIDGLLDGLWTRERRLVLWTWGRVPTSSLEHSGSIELLDAWNFMPRMGI